MGQALAWPIYLFGHRQDGGGATLVPRVVGLGMNWLARNGGFMGFPELTWVPQVMILLIFEPS
jgi:hypothetical protein